MIARFSWSVGVDQPSFSMFTRPSLSTSTTVAFIGSTKSFMELESGGRRRPQDVVHAEDDRLGTAVAVIQVDPGVCDEPQRDRGGRPFDHEHVTLGHVVPALAEHARAVHVVVDEQAQLARRAERHRHDIHAFISKQTTNAGERAGVVGQSKRELRADQPSTRMTMRRFWARPSFVLLSATGFVM